VYSRSRSIIHWRAAQRQINDDSIKDIVKQKHLAHLSDGVIQDYEEKAD